MKSLSKTILGITTAAMLTLYACEDPNAASPAGDDRDLFTGTWNCKDSGTYSGTSSYPVTINKIGDFDSVAIKNFYMLGNTTSAIALVSGSSITIPNQIDDNITVFGTGILSNDKINWTYFTIDASIKDTVKSVYSR